MPGKLFTKKGWKVYHGIRRKGASKAKAARITSSIRGTRRRKR